MLLDCMLWYGIPMLWYGIPMLWYDNTMKWFKIPMLCHAMVYVEKDMLEMTVHMKTCVLATPNVSNETWYYLQILSLMQWLYEV